jgi:hypothetical protein
MNERLKGKRITLIRMNDDPNPIKANEQGTIRGEDGMGHIHVDWDNGRSLSLIPGVDVYKIEQ